MPTPKKRTITAEDLYRFQNITHCQISPDGQVVAFCLWRVDDKKQKKYSNLWLTPTGQGAPRQFTYGNQVDSQPRWSPDGREIAFISNRGDEKQPQIYLIPFDGGEARPLTNLKGELGGFEWSPDGRQLVGAFRKMDKDALEREEDEQKKELGVVDRHITRLIYKADGEGFLPQERWHIWTIDARTGRAKQLTGGDIYDERNPTWSPDGQAIAFVSNRSDDPDRTWDQDNLFVIPAAGGELRKIETAPGPKNSPRFSPDGRWLAYYQEASRQELWRKTNLWLAPVNNNGPAKNLTQPFDFHVGQDTLNDIDKISVIPPIWSPDSQKLYFQVTHYGDTLLKSIQIDGNNLQDIISTQGVSGDVTFDCSGAKMAYAQGEMTTPGQVWLRDFSTGRTRKLTRFNETLLRGIDLGQVEEIWFKGPDHNDLQGWIIKPPGFDESKKYPSILEIHGGPMAQYGHYFMHEFYFLAGQGYVVHFCNPRGGVGYGEAHTKAIYNDWGAADYADIMAWVEVVRQKPYIDAGRMGVTGGSYGGFMTNWIIGHTDQFKAAVTQRSVSNFISMSGSSDLGNVWDALFGAERAFWEDVDNFWRQSPLKYVGHVKTPTLVIHSEQDLRCDIEQGEQMFVALKKVGVETELVRFPGESHGLSREGRTDRRIARLKHILRWFDKYLKA
jgi:dipeptidyl aminopeptidase/acylaminoacyl peptidase